MSEGTGTNCRPTNLGELVQEGLGDYERVGLLVTVGMTVGDGGG